MVNRDKKENWKAISARQQNSSMRFHTFRRKSADYLDIIKYFYQSGGLFYIAGNLFMVVVIYLYVIY